MPMPDPVSRLAVLGDSDSESYAHQRGGRHAAKTLQWTEVLGQLRPRQLDLGAWGSWGMPGTLTRWQRQMGGSLWWRGPRKYDNEFNFAISGAKCEDLMTAGRQAPVPGRPREPGRGWVGSWDCRDSHRRQ